MRSSVDLDSVSRDESPRLSFLFSVIMNLESHVWGMEMNFIEGLFPFNILPAGFKIQTGCLTLQYTFSVLT